MPKRFITLDFYNEKNGNTDGPVYIAADAIEAIRPHWSEGKHRHNTYTHCTIHTRSGELWPVNATLEQIEDAIDALSGIESVSS